MKRTMGRSGGWSLVEVMLVVGALMGVGALAYQANTRSVLASEVQLEQGNVKALSAAITDSYGAIGTFANVSSIAMSNAGLAPMVMRSGTGLVHSWGAAVDLAPATFAAANDGFAITYNDIPAIACGRFVTAAARGATDVTVNGATVMVNRNVVPTTVTTQCQGAANDIVFRYRAADGAQISAPAIAAPAPDPGAPATPPCAGCPPAAIIPSVVPLAPPVGPSPVAPGAPVPGGALVPVATTPCSTPTDESRSVACPAGQVGAKTERRTRACGAAVWGGWSTFYDGCRPVSSIPIVAPPPPAGTCYACPTGAGWVQNSNYNPAWPGSAVCGPGAPPWCVLPCTPSSSTQWVATAGSCAAGFSGARNWEREQLRNYTCPANAWGAYADTGATRNLVDTCAPTCVPNSQTQWIAVAGTCAAGYTGSRTWEKQQQRNYTCPAAAWGAYADTGATRNLVDTCAPSVPPMIKDNTCSAFMGSQVQWTDSVTGKTCMANLFGSLMKGDYWDAFGTEVGFPWGSGNWGSAKIMCDPADPFGMAFIAQPGGTCRGPAEPNHIYAPIVGGAAPPDGRASPVAQQPFGAGACAAYRVYTPAIEMPGKAMIGVGDARKHLTGGEYSRSYFALFNTNLGGGLAGSSMNITYGGQTVRLDATCDTGTNVPSGSSCANSVSAVIGGVTFTMGVGAKITIDPVGYPAAPFAGTNYAQSLTTQVTLASSLGFLPPPCP